MTTTNDFSLSGKHVRLEALTPSHASALADARSTGSSVGGGSLYDWSPIPRTEPEARQYIDTALSWKSMGTAVPFVIIRQSDDAVIGSSRFWNIERWGWPPNHPQHGRTTPDACEIGYTWFTRSAIRTSANTESKLLMLTHAFEVWNVFRVCFHTDARNDRSRAALERIGGRFEGILRAHRMAADFIPRDSVRYSIVASEWPVVKRRLNEMVHSRT